MPEELFLIDGNSLAYRAFFALPESIATSTGVPTNAIFGFASMLVKILTDYGPKATVVVWDAGYTGRKELYPEYKAQRSTRPDLLKEQWPHLAPLVEAFGYRNLRVEGYEADDVIASIVENARHQDPPIPVMVVTGDRDAYQLVDDGVRIMTTSRGITDTRVYDRDGVVDRYGIPPELIPDFIGLKGDTSDNIPGVPGIGDKTAAELLQRFGSLEEVLSHIDDISGAKRKQNLTDHAEAARISKQLATAKRDIPLDLDLQTYASTDPDRSKLRDTFREFELRDPLRRLEEALGSADAAAPAPEAEHALTATVKQATLNDVKRLPHTETAIAVTPPDVPDGALFAATDQGWRFAVHQDGSKEVLTGTTPNPEELVAAIGTRPAIAHDAKSLGEVPKTLAHDTEIGAYLLEPARLRVPVPRAVRGARAGDGHRIRSGRLGRAARPRPGHMAAQRDPRPRPHRPLQRGRASARQAAAKDGAGRAEARHRAPANRSPTASRPRLTSSSARSSSSPARSSRSARPSSSRRSCSESSASPASAAARPATRPTPACSRRSEQSTR